MRSVPPKHRSIPKTLKSFGGSLFWIFWDWFWGRFDLRPVGDEMREHSVLMRKRAKAFVTILVIAMFAAYFGSCVQKSKTEDLRSKLETANGTIRDLRAYDAGLPHKESPAELMGFHDETNIVVTTNLITKSAFLTNMVIIYTAHPVLDFLQMERIKSKLVYTPFASIQVLAQTNDDAAMGLAKQIGQTFLAAGFNPTVGGFDVNSHVAHSGVTFSAKTIPTNSIAEAYIQLSHELFLPLSWNVDTGAPNYNFAFLVTMTHK